MFLEFNNVTIILMYLALILLSGFLITSLTKLLKLPDVSGYVLAGILIGPYGLRLLNMDKDIRKYLGLALIPQAGVAIGLAFLGQRMLPPDIGNKLLTIIPASSVLYELVGPVSAKLALVYSGAIKKHKEINSAKISNIC